MAQKQQESFVILHPLRHSRDSGISDFMLLRLNFPFVALFTSRCFEKSTLREGSLIAVAFVDVL